MSAVVDVLVPRYRERAGALFGLPPAEALRVSLVHDQPWSGYNWYDGGYRSRVDLNLDLPIRLPALVGIVAHETYPGHHLEHALKEQVLVEELGRLESSILLINTPECLLSEGLANVGRAIVVPPDGDGRPPRRAGAGRRAADGRRCRRACGRPRRARRPWPTLRATLAESRINAALMLHVDGAPRDEAIDYMVEVGRTNPDTAAKRIEFVSHPLWRLYDYVYTEGEALLWPWLDAVPDAQRARALRPAAPGAADAGRDPRRDRRRAAIRLGAC